MGDLATADSLVGEVRELFSGLREDHRYRLALGRTEAELAMARGGADDVVARLEAILEAEARVRPTPHPRKGVTQRLPETDAAPALVEGETYYLYVLRDVNVPITRCLFTAPAP